MLCEAAHPWVRTDPHDRWSRVGADRSLAGGRIARHRRADRDPERRRAGARGARVRGHPRTTDARAVESMSERKPRRRSPPTASHTAGSQTILIARTASRPTGGIVMASHSSRRQRRTGRRHAPRAPRSGVAVARPRRPATLCRLPVSRQAPSIAGASKMPSRGRVGTPGCPPPPAGKIVLRHSDFILPLSRRKARSLRCEWHVEMGSAGVPEMGDDMFDNVLVVLDGRPSSERIVGWVRRFCRRSGGRVRLVAVRDPERTVWAEAQPVAFGSQLEDSTRLETEAYLRGVATRLARAGVSVEVEVRFGAPVESVLAAARDSGATVVALAAGARTDGGDRRGQLARALLARAPIPVLLSGSCGQRAA